ncbi:hypothetical protein F5X68DRAFT_27102 [Plectosphaerella plurivora]|uniref:Uncharacterized protein n=1 Tax=Plectosphaerella plurivora TaxID=936078 RepID=A0A9P9A6G2_9PEZI|nr:hypothetical protein F5X68DRAFT_27102 [Plectosphaerella plurivora]
MSANAGDAPAAGAESPTGSPRTLSTSLQAAATLNAGLQHESPRRSSSGSFSRNNQSPSAGRRRSTVLMNLQLNDPSIPAPGEMVNDGSHGASPSQTGSPLMVASPQMVPGSGDPHHNRAPSLGELHQELEAEQEAQVNRLLHTIRQQQAQLQRLQETPGADESAVLPDTTSNGTSSVPKPAHHSIPHPRSPSISHNPRSSLDMARADLHRRSRTPSRGASPRLRATSISGESDQPSLGRDESAFYQAETQMLVRENQMLRHRIRDLERQLSDASVGSPTQANPSEPVFPSNLTRAVSADEEAPGNPTISEATEAAENKA